jgi:hypothetical protein
MEPVQKQVIALSHKVDALYQVVDNLNARVSEAFSECRLSPIQGTNNSLGVDSVGHYSIKAIAASNRRWNTKTC